MIIQKDYNEKELKRIARLSGSKQAEKDAHIVGYLGYKEPQKMYCEYIGGVAFIDGMIGKNLLRIYGIAVAESHKRRGIATYLLQRALLFAKEQGLKKVTTITIAGLSFYLKNNFRVVGMNSKNEFLMEINIV